MLLFHLLIWVNGIEIGVLLAWMWIKFRGGTVQYLDPESPSGTEIQ